MNDAWIPQRTQQTDYRLWFLVLPLVVRSHAPRVSPQQRAERFSRHRALRGEDVNRMVARDPVARSFQEAPLLLQLFPKRLTRPRIPDAGVRAQRRERQAAFHLEELARDVPSQDDHALVVRRSHEGAGGGGRLDAEPAVCSEQQERVVDGARRVRQRAARFLVHFSSQVAFLSCTLQ